MQAHLARLRATSRAQAFVASCSRMTRATEDWRSHRARHFFGPVINAESLAKFERAVAQRAGRGDRARRRPAHRGAGSTAAISSAPPSRLPLESALFREELFVPFLASVSIRAGARDRRNEPRRIMDCRRHLFKRDAKSLASSRGEAGVCYVISATGAPTGAWPGRASVHRMKGWGSSGKGGCGPYYVAQIHREQSRTVIDHEQQSRLRVSYGATRSKAGAIVERQEPFASTSYPKVYPLAGRAPGTDGRGT